MADLPRLLPLTDVGDTYPHRAALKKMGGLWYPRTKMWLIPETRIEEARALVGPPQPRAPRPAPPRRTREEGPPPGWAPCGYPGCTWYLCDDCDGRGAGRWGR